MKLAEIEEGNATQHICKSVKNAPIQCLQFNSEGTAFFDVRFADPKSKYGSVKPPNGIWVAELILCDAYYMALLSHSPLHTLSPIICLANRQLTPAHFAFRSCGVYFCHMDEMKAEERFNQL